MKKLDCGGMLKRKNQESKSDIHWVRVYLLDELVFHNGKQITPDLIGEITQSVVDKLKEKL